MKRQRNMNVGDLMHEIQEQDLMAPVGGIKDDGAEPQSILSVLSAISAFTALSAWSHDKATRKFGCGEILTASAECSASGSPC